MGPDDVARSLERVTTDSEISASSSLQTGVACVRKLIAENVDCVRTLRANNVHRWRTHFPNVNVSMLEIVRRVLAMVNMHACRGR